MPRVTGPSYCKLLDLETGDSHSLSLLVNLQAAAANEEPEEE